MTPVSPDRRIALLDALRGAALFGILASNMRAFNGPMAAYFDHSLMWTGVTDRIAQGLMDLFVTGKFITLFAFLFGIGFAIQMDRAAERGSATAFYLRRLAILLSFGLVHGFLIWSGDILAPYALMGFALYLFRKRSQKCVAWWALGLYLWPLVPLIAATVATAAGVRIPLPPRPGAVELARIIQVYSAGTYAQIFHEHVNEMAHQSLGLFFFYPRVLGLFLAGMWVWRSGIPSNVVAHASLLRSCRTYGLAIGFAGNAAMLVIREIWHPGPYTMDWINLVQNLIATVGIPAMSLFYASAFALAWTGSARWAARFAPFAAVGRTALSNYLLQSVVCTTLYNSWGFGLFGKVSPLLGLVPTLAIFSIQLAGSVQYTARFAFGPCEWVWRVLTYGRLRDRPLEPAGA